MMRQELGWNLSLPNWSGNLIRLFSKWKVKISIWRKGRYLNPAPKLWEDSLCPILLGLCQRHSCLQEQQCFSVFVLFQHRSHKTIIHIFTLNPNYKSFASRTIIPFPNLTGEFKMLLYVLLKVCGETKRTGITSAIIPGFVLSVNNEKITCDIISLTWNIILTVFDLKRETYWHQDLQVLVTGLTWQPRRQKGLQYVTPCWERWLLHWQTPNQSGLSPTLMWVDSALLCQFFCHWFEINGSILFQI